METQLEDQRQRNKRPQPLTRRGSAKHKDPFCHHPHRVKTKTRMTTSKNKRDVNKNLTMGT